MKSSEQNARDDEKNEGKGAKLKMNLNWSASSNSTLQTQAY